MGIRTNIGTILVHSGFKHRFLMARMTRIPALGRMVERAFFDEDEMIYLPKDSVVRKPRSGPSI